MLELFSCIATKDGKVHFTEEDCHMTIVHRLGLVDDGENWIKIQYASIDKLVTYPFPEWYERTAFKLKEDVIKLYKKVKPLMKKQIGMNEEEREELKKEFAKIEGYVPEDYISKKQAMKKTEYRER